MAVRRNEVARSLDLLDRQRADEGQPITAADVIAMNVGASFLDGTIGDSFLTGPRRGTPPGMRTL